MQTPVFALVLTSPINPQIARRPSADGYAVTAERLDAKRVYLGAPEAEGRYDMQTGEMPTVRPKKMQSAASRALRALR